MNKDHVKIASLVLVFCVTLLGHSAFAESKTPAPHPPILGEMVSVPAGEFWMGCNDKVDSECQDDEKPGREVYLDAFQIDKTEVTVDAYAACVNAGTCTPPNTTTTDCSGDYARWNNWGKSGRGNHPVNCVSWDQANTYCKWTGKQLPTEAQWEKAARGTDGRKYPWGDAKATCDYAVMDEAGYGCGENSTMPVGSKVSGASPYGALDMSGNVWEWTADWYDRSYDASSPSRNPTGSSSGSMRVFRSGGFGSLAALLRASNRYYYSPGRTGFALGLRCASPASP